MLNYISPFPEINRRIYYLNNVELYDTITTDSKLYLVYTDNLYRPDRYHYRTRLSYCQKTPYVQLLSNVRSKKKNSQKLLVSILSTQFEIVLGYRFLVTMRCSIISKLFKLFCSSPRLQFNDFVNNVKLTSYI